MRRRAILAVTALISACGGSSDTSGPPVPDPPANVVISPAGPLTIAALIQTSLTAIVTTRTGASVSNPTIAWKSSDSSVVLPSGGSIMGRQVGSATITATATGSNGSASGSIAVTVTPGPASALAIRTQPIAANTYTTFSVQPVVEVRDGAGNLITTSSAPVTAAISTGAGTLGGTTTVNAVNGVATFSDLIISGATGTRSLSFNSPGLFGAIANPVTLAPPVAPLVVLDSASLSFNAQLGASLVSKTVRISNGGGTPFAPPSVDLIKYDDGQPTGWVSTNITGIGAPFSLTVTPSSASLPTGSYHATIRISAPGALNTPVSLSVTLQIVPSFNIAFGTGLDKVKVADPGTSLVALTTLLNGTAQPPASVTFASRATSVATVNAAGVITAVAPGQSWVVASESGVSDSVLVIVTNNASGPVLRTDLTTFVAKSGDILTVNFTLDPRTTIVAGATVVVGYETENGMFSLQTARAPTQTPQPVTFASSPGVFKVNVATATGLTGPIVMLQLVLRANAPGLAGWLTFSVLDAVGADGTDVASRTTSTRYPIIIK